MSLQIIDRLTSLNGKATIDTVSVVLKDIDIGIHIKQYKDNKDLYLIYNNFSSTNTDELYKECRSFTISIVDSIGKIVSYSHGTIESINSNEFTSLPNDTFEQSFEGTLITTFYYDGKWYFHTSRCTNMDDNYYLEQSNTFGKMFDECLVKLHHDRKSFTDKMDTNHCYSFVMVHHNNMYITDYTETFGPDYKEMFLIIEREMSECKQFISPDTLDEESLGITRYNTLESCQQFSKNLCIICKRNGHFFKITTPEYLKKCRQNVKYTNVWHSYIQIFLDNDKEQTIAMFREQNNITEDYIIDGLSVDIVGMISLLYTHTATIVMNLVNHFTEFDYENGSYTKKCKDDYLLLQDPKYNTIRHVIATVQYLVNKGTIQSTNHIVMNLRRQYEPKHFTKLLTALSDLNIAHDFCDFKNKYYENYVNFLIEQIN